VLDPSQKTEHIRKYWGDDKLESLLKQAEEAYKNRYLEMYGNNLAPAPRRRTGQSATRKLGILIRELSDDEDDADSSPASPIVPEDLRRAPWQKDFNGYLNSKDQLGNLTITEWWGWNATRYPVWASLARDMLPIMASSVSSERAFSSAGITITKRRNRLKPDIVEALQFLKCLYHHDLLFREEASTQFEVEEFGNPNTEDIVAENDKGWDRMVEDLADDEGYVDSDGEEVFVQEVGL